MPSCEPPRPSDTDAGGPTVNAKDALFEAEKRNPSSGCTTPRPKRLEGQFEAKSGTTVPVQPTSGSASLRSETGTPVPPEKPGPILSPPPVALPAPGPVPFLWMLLPAKIAALFLVANGILANGGHCA